jgi:hypothetical protein
MMDCLRFIVFGPRRPREMLCLDSFLERASYRESKYEQGLHVPVTLRLRVTSFPLFRRLLLSEKYDAESD